MPHHSSDLNSRREIDDDNKSDDEFAVDTAHYTETSCNQCGTGGCCCILCRCLSVPQDACLCCPPKFYPNAKSNRRLVVMLAQFLMIAATAFSMQGVIDCEYVHAKSEYVDPYILPILNVPLELAPKREHTALGLFFFEDATNEGSCACDPYGIAEENLELYYPSDIENDEENVLMTLEPGLKDLGQWENKESNKEGDEDVVDETEVLIGRGKTVGVWNDEGSEKEEDVDLADADRGVSSPPPDDYGPAAEISPIPPLPRRPKDGMDNWRQQYNDFLPAEWEVARSLSCLAAALTLVWMILLLTYTCLAHTKRMRQMWTAVAVFLLTPLQLTSLPLVLRSDVCQQADCIVGRAAVVSAMAAPFFLLSAGLLYWSTKNYYPGMERFERPDHEIQLDNDDNDDRRPQLHHSTDPPPRGQAFAMTAPLTVSIGTASTNASSNDSNPARRQADPESGSSVEDENGEGLDGLGDAREVPVPPGLIQAMMGAGTISTGGRVESSTAEE